MRPLPTSVATIAELATARARTANGAVVTTTGHLTVGDNGGASYIYNRTGRSLVTIGKVNIAGPGVDDYWKLLILDECKSSQFGAIGDGAADDLSALQAADAAATAAGAVSVTLTPGVYKVSDDITFANPVRFLDGARIKPVSGKTFRTTKGFVADAQQWIFDITDGGLFEIEGASQISARNFGADPTGSVESSEELNTLYGVAAVSDCGICISNGSFLINQQVTVGELIADPFDHTQNKTKKYEGSMTLICTGTFENALVIQNAYSIVWDGKVQVYGTGSEGIYSTYTITNGVVLRGVNHSRFTGFYVRRMRGDGVLIDGDLPAFTYFNVIDQIYSLDCGSAGSNQVDMAAKSVSGTWTNRVDSGSDGAFAQRTTLTLSSLPPASTDSIPHKILNIDGVPYQVMSMNRGASSVEVYPWITPRVPVVFSYTTDTFTATAHGYVLNDIVTLIGTLPAEFSTGAEYYVVNVTSDTFQLSATPSGSAITALNSNGSGIIALKGGGSYKWMFGAGVRVTGSEAQGSLFGHVSAIRTGHGAAVESLYGPIINSLTTQFVGSAVTLGQRYDAIIYGTAINSLYAELTNEFDFILRTTVANAVFVGSSAPTNSEHYKQICAPTLGNAPHPYYNLMKGCTFGLDTGLCTPGKPLNNAEIGYSIIPLEISVPRHVVYYNDTMTIALELISIGTTEKLGMDSFSFSVKGSGDNGAPTGIITVNPPTGWSINGGTVNVGVSFQGFTAQTTFIGYMNVADMNIELDFTPPTPEPQAVSTVLTDFEASVNEVLGPTTYTELLDTASSVLGGDADGNGTGDANDHNGNYNGTWTGTPVYGAPPVYRGKSFKFDGSKYITQVSAAGDFTDNFTVAAWVKFNANSDAARIVSKRNGATGWDFYATYLGALSFTDGGTVGQSAQGLITLGTWHHVAAVLNGANSQLYHNGVAVGSTFPLNIQSNAILVNWGQYPTGDARLTGEIFQGCIFNAVLTADNIALLYDRNLSEVVHDNTATTANLESLTAEINTVDKYEGKHIFNSDTNKPLWASGSSANAVWVDATGSTAHTPV